MESERQCEGQEAMNAESPDHPLQLYVDAQFCSPYALSAFVALHEKGLAFDVITVDLAANANHAADFAGRSLTHRVPTLVHDDFSLSESSAITEYLDEIFPSRPRLYPTDARQRARARQVQAWLRSDLMPIRQERPTEIVFYGPVSRALSQDALAAAHRLYEAAQSLLSAGDMSLFGSWSIADIDLSMMLNRLVMNGDAVPPSLAAYATHHWHHPAVQLWMKQPRPNYRRW
jgi:glutathione S-transferase